VAYIRKDGSRLPIILSVTAIRNDQNLNTGYLGIAKNISDQLLHEKIQKKFTN
jgi:hypothetical protein